jgi:molybdate transport system substrate-binding protein
MSKDRTFRLGEVATLLGVSADTVRRWVDAGRLAARRTKRGERRVGAAALARFAAELGSATEPSPVSRQSARNRFPGIITRVIKDRVAAQVEIQAGPHRLVSLMTREAADELGLAPGQLASAVVKATNVVIELPEPVPRSRPRRASASAARRSLAALFLALGLSLSRGARAEEAGGQPILVFAAASLSESFTALAKAFETAHPGAKVEQSFAGSPALVAQIESGAPADLIATADTVNMDKLAQAELLDGTPTPFAGNRLEIAVEHGNPKRVRGLADLARKDLVVILAAEAVPAGRYAREALKKAGVTVGPKSLEENVKAVVNKVALGEADAGIVYATDVQAAGEHVTGVVIPEAENVVAIYPIALVKRAVPRPLAREFQAFILSAEGQKILASFGFSAE